MNETKCKMFEGKLTNGQLIFINKMIAEKRLNGSKDSIVSGFTNGRSSDPRELFVNEATDIIRYLKTLKPGQVN
jgi:hypothetical protein